MRTTKDPGKPWRVSPPYPDGGFDELVIAHWFHLERMSRRGWWLKVGEHVYDIETRANGDVVVREREERWR